MVVHGLDTQLDTNEGMPSQTLLVESARFVSMASVSLATVKTVQCTPPVPGLCPWPLKPCLLLPCILGGCPDGDFPRFTGQH